ncbi:MULTISPECIES: hypothetical protein [unclassified Bacillus (in: firmicutes)]|uniref:hypothetical protein n=1 Tax=unclassified Bacillus (in: firmicutes) TaxID=185979 RepID=UPI0008EB4D5E|nr:MULTISPECIES: hypothetical protein [unclassified Bacillus (in: firmicutes)]SFA98163.1 hypothetical protein SAMN02799634_103324 [Bacillus sp. UNCCL13]SFQ80861.1 hypothetical protein SAMN04488577_1953 [Bacillus sp. cl95]
MWKKWVQTIMAVFCGYLFVKWVPVTHPFHITDFLLEFIFDPLEFLAASISFVAGLLLIGPMVQETILYIIQLVKGKQKLRLQSLYGLCIPSGMFVIAGSGIVQTAVFFSISLIYGMILVRY